MTFYNTQIYCSCGKPGSASCSREQCSACCEAYDCQRHFKHRNPIDSDSTKAKAKVRHFFYVDEGVKRSTIVNNERNEFSKIDAIRNAIPQINDAEIRIRRNKQRIEQARNTLPIDQSRQRQVLMNEELAEFRDIWNYKNSIHLISHAEYIVRLKRNRAQIEKSAVPIKAVQTRKRNVLYQEYKNEYIGIFKLMEKDFRDSIVVDEDKEFDDILKNKSDNTSLQKMEEWMNKKNEIKRRDR